MEIANSVPTLLRWLRDAKHTDRILIEALDWPIRRRVGRALAMRD